MFNPRITGHPRPALAILLTACLALVGTAPTMGQSDERHTDADEQLRYALNVSQAFQEVTRRIGPSVVNITTSAEVPRQQMPGFGNSPFDEMFERFFDDVPPQFRPQQQQQPRQQLPPQIRQGQGSGVIINEDGYIVTNYHVVAQADEISVRLTDGREHQAEVIGVDQETDLAVLRIESDYPLQPATFGDSEKLNAGEWVLAVGNAFGFEHSVTQGIVSATGRGGLGLAIYENFIQTDAAINPGNSGGPLVNLHGEVVGINTAIASRTGGYQGIGFAIPTSIAEPVFRSIIERGEVVRGYLGISMNPLTEDLAASLNFPGEDGVAVVDIVPGGPAESAGVQIGDVITHVNEEPVRDLDELRNAIALFPPETTVELRIFRNGEERRQEVTLGTRPSPEELAGTRRPSQPQQGELGLTVQQVTPDIARQLRMPEPRGVIVRDVDPRSISARAGIRPNDIILTVGNREIQSEEDYYDAVSEANLAEGLRLRVQRGNVIRFYVLRGN